MFDVSRRDPIAVVTDERVPREKLRLLTRAINELRRTAMVQVFEGGISEEELLAKLKEKPFKLVLAPWYRYLSWNKIEGFFGLARNSGPTFAGYFAEPVMPYELGDPLERQRAILLDLAALQPGEAVMLVKSLTNDAQRSGIRPLLLPDTPVYSESWFGGQGLGHKLDTAVVLPEVVANEWSRRSNAIRILITALWSMVYEEGPGKSGLCQAQSASSKTPLAYFQIAADRHCLLLRLCYSSPGVVPKEFFSPYWPDAKRPNSPQQLLLKHSDFVRVHTVADSNDVEITTGLFASAVSENYSQHAHTLWVEPIASQLVTELPYETPGPGSPHIRILPAKPMEAADTARSSAESEARLQQKAKERFIFRAAMKIRELKKAIGDREELIRELRSGGIGTTQVLPPPEAEALLDAFQARYFESRYMIQQFERQIADAERHGANTNELEALKQRIDVLITRERGWIKKIAETLDNFRKAAKSTGA